MKAFRPSLVRRLTLGYMLAHALALALFLLALWPLARLDEEDHVGPDIAVSLLRERIVRADGAIQVIPDVELDALTRDSPRFWFAVRDGEGRLIRRGEVPAAAEALLALPASIKSAQFGGIGAAARTGDASVEVADTPAGRVVIAAGGIEPGAVTLSAWLGYLRREDYLLLPLLSALFTLLGGLIAIPLVLRSLRPTVRAAAAIEAADLSRRLPERRVVREMLPLVRAFNAALDRLADGFERRKRFIADVAHELRTPLAVMTMHVDALPETGTKRELRRTVFRVGQMVSQMLDAERLALAGRKHEPVDMVALAREAVANIAPLAVGAGYEVEFAAERDAVPIDGDRHALSRALANLLGNAVAHGGGAGTIGVRVHGDGHVDVHDDGPGVAEEAQERIFEPFHRERWDRDGCGLGLHLVREIMRAHGGDALLVPSAHGSIFRLRFSPAPASGIEHERRAYHADAGAMSPAVDWT